MAVPSPFPANTRGIYYSVDWAQVEPANRVFDWTPVTKVEALLSAGQYMHLVIFTGAYGSPTSNAVCSRYGNLVPNCSPWLATAGVSGVGVHSEMGPNGSAHGYALCTPLFDPNPADPIYQTAYEGLISDAEAQFSGDPKISLITIAPMSNVGLNVSLAVANTTVGCGEFYNSAWNAVSGCNGNESCWQIYVENAFNTLWSYQVAHLSNQNLALWVQSTPFPAVTCADGCLDPNETGIRTAVFGFASAHKPANGKYYLANETLQTSESWLRAISPYAPGADGLGAQMARTLPNDCPALESAGITFGADNGAEFEEIQSADFPPCAAQIAAISAALGGP
jgi:hypothetical protein